MNQRIKELIEQSGTDTSGKWMIVEQAEKLAKLIVKDCSDLVFSRDPRFEPSPHIYLLKAFEIKDE